MLWLNDEPAPATLANAAAAVSSETEFGSSSLSFARASKKKAALLGRAPASQQPSGPRECIVIFGGQYCVNGPYTYLNDVHVSENAFEPFVSCDRAGWQVWDATTRAWTAVRTSGPKPAPRGQHSAQVSLLIPPPAC